jgi:hypothetical protein
VSPIRNALFWHDEFTKKSKIFLPRRDLEMRRGAIRKFYDLLENERTMNIYSIHPDYEKSGYSDKIRNCGKRSENVSEIV